MFVDTHAHLTEKLYENFVKDVVMESKLARVEKIITVGTCLDDSRRAVEIAGQFEGVWASVGLHPCEVDKSWKNHFSEIEFLLKEKNKIVAIGETGLDFYHKPYDKGLQTDLFIAHIECCIKYDLPIILHIRDSADDVLKILESYANKLRGVAHCFMQSEEVARVLIKWGFYLGIGGPITYPKNEWYRDMLRGLPIDRILLETDAPYLPPQDYRGKPNYPKYIPLIAEVVASAKEIENAVVEESTTANAKLLFSI